jgi:hypothetical protein
MLYDSGTSTLPLIANWYANVTVPGASTLTSYAVMTLPSAATYIQGETSIQYATRHCVYSSSAIFLLPPRRYIGFYVGYVGTSGAATLILAGVTFSQLSG